MDAYNGDTTRVRTPLLQLRNDNDDIINEVLNFHALAGRADSIVDDKRNRADNRGIAQTTGKSRA